MLMKHTLQEAGHVHVWLVLGKALHEMTTFRESVQVGFVALHAKASSDLVKEPLPRGTACLKDDASRNIQRDFGPGG